MKMSVKKMSVMKMSVMKNPLFQMMKMSVKKMLVKKMAVKKKEVKKNPPVSGLTLTAESKKPSFMANLEFLYSIYFCIWLSL